MGFCLGLSYENGIFDSHQKYHCSFKCNMFIRDLRIKHLNAFICQWLKINESDIHGYFFDGEVYYETDDEDNRIEDSDFECLCCWRYSQIRELEPQWCGATTGMSKGLMPL